MRAKTIPELFQAAVDDHGPRTAMRYRREGDWHPVTYAQLGRLVEEATVGLAELGVDPGEPVGLVTEPRPLAVVADLATVHARAATACLAPSQDIDRLLDDLSSLGIELVFASPDVADALARQADDEVPTVIALADEDPPATGSADGVRRLAMRDLYRRGQQVLGQRPEPFQQRWRAVDAGGPAAVLAGVPRSPAGAEPLVVTHANVCANVAAAASAWPIDAGERAVSLCPLADRFGREAGHLAMHAQGAEVWFPQRERLPEHLRAARPHLLLSPTEALARLTQDVDDRLAASQPLQRQLFAWAREIGEAADRARADGERPGRGLRARRWLADRLVLAKLRAEMGLEVTRAIVAPAGVPEELARWYRAIGAPLVCPYTHPAVGPVTTPDPEARRPGTRGEPAARVDVRRAEGSGELLVRGASVPDHVVADDGWLHTGDRGRWEAADERVLAEIAASEERG